ncbi:hypothetical protein L596_010894 [Steinernema carpocapsae]|uniref:Uncharacterized protein n=1 Tax=Steinernema carpocapsae TaxID=34508 RepID=A0A4U5PJP9_STECR|nr:hypothetical protein L596_010894 [Steinernema carpocapsae]
MFESMSPSHSTAVAVTQRGLEGTRKSGRLDWDDAQSRPVSLEDKCVLVRRSLRVCAHGDFCEFALAEKTVKCHVVGETESAQEVGND